MLDEFTTDWLSSRTIYYNVRTNQISDNVNELIDSDHIAINPEGLANYLQYGYCVFGQTPIDEIRFLTHNQSITKDLNGKLVIENRKDPFDSLMGVHSEPDEVIDELDSVVNMYIKSRNSVIVPTSGGFDSRLIDSVIRDTERVSAYTFGLSRVQSESLEVVYAQKVCEKLGIKWDEIPLGNYVGLIDEWDDLYGISTHSHGMYQMEFYSKLRERIGTSAVISGIFGDIWAGNWDFPAINRPEELIVLGKSYVEHVDLSYCKLKCNYELRDCYFETNKEKLKDRNWRVLEAGRRKIILISYLLRVPEYYGFQTWSPFLHESIVSKMINLDWKIKEKRKWQVDYFKRKGLLVGELGLKCDSSNVLNQLALSNNPPTLLNSKLLGEVIHEKYVDWINDHIGKGCNDLEYWYGYQVLYPLQKILEIKEYGRKMRG